MCIEETAQTLLATVLDPLPDKRFKALQKKLVTRRYTHTSRDQLALSLHTLSSWILRWLIIPLTTQWPVPPVLDKGHGYSAAKPLQLCCP